MSWRDRIRFTFKIWETREEHIEIVHWQHWVGLGWEWCNQRVGFMIYVEGDLWRTAELMDQDCEIKNWSVSRWTPIVGFWATEWDLGTVANQCATHLKGALLLNSAEDYFLYNIKYLSSLLFQRYFTTQFFSLYLISFNMVVMRSQSYLIQNPVQCQSLV